MVGREQGKVLAVIPARGGSKGLPGKNLRPLLGIPLIEWTIRAALKAAHVDKVVVSTDSLEIQNVSIAAGAEAPFLRPSEISGDTARTIDAVLHALEYFHDKTGENFEYVVLLEPTSPIREPEDIDSCIQTLISRASDFDAVITVGKAPHHPLLMKKASGGVLEPYFQTEFSESRRQDLGEAYFPFGVAYVVKVSVLMNEQTFYPRRQTYFEIQRHQGYEIDDLEDFVCVEAILNSRKMDR